MHWSQGLYSAGRTHLCHSSCWKGKKKFCLTNKSCWIINLLCLIEIKGTSIHGVGPYKANAFLNYFFWVIEMFFGQLQHNGTPPLDVSILAKRYLVEHTLCYLCVCHTTLLIVACDTWSVPVTHPRLARWGVGANSEQLEILQHIGKFSDGSLTFWIMLKTKSPINAVM